MHGEGHARNSACATFMSGPSRVGLRVSGRTTEINSHLRGSSSVWSARGPPGDMALQPQEAYALILPCDKGHLTVGCTTDVGRAAAFLDTVRREAPFYVQVTQVTAASGIVTGVPAAARGPADASRWRDAEGSHGFHIRGAPLGAQRQVRPAEAYARVVVAASCREGRRSREDEGQRLTKALRDADASKPGDVSPSAGASTMQNARTDPQGSTPTGSRQHLSCGICGRDGTASSFAR